MEIEKGSIVVTVNHLGGAFKLIVINKYLSNLYSGCLSLWLMSFFGVDSMLISFINVEVH